MRQSSTQHTKTKLDKSMTALGTKNYDPLGNIPAPATPRYNFVTRCSEKTLTAILFSTDMAAVRESLVLVEKLFSGLVPYTASGERHISHARQRIWRNRGHSYIALQDVCRSSVTPQPQFSSEGTNCVCVVLVRDACIWVPRRDCDTLSKTATRSTSVFACAKTTRSNRRVGLGHR
jgi:hypothetical protein